MAPDRPGRDGRRGGTRPYPMTDDPSMRAMHINQLKERIERSTYTVDPGAVAEALLRRPAARRTILPAVSRSGARSRSANGSLRPR
jgi:Anti-sigma-28 factor, FlgM